MTQKITDNTWESYMAERDLSQGVGQASPGFSSINQSPPTPEEDRQAQGGPQGGRSRVDLKTKVSDDAQSVKDMGRDALQSASAKAEEVATEQKTYLARQIGSLGSALEKVSSELSREDNADLARLTTRLGAGIRSFANDVEGQDLRNIVSRAEDFGRRQPMAFLGIAALAGLAASRFLTASSQNSQASAGSYTDRAGASQHSDVSSDASRSSALSGQTAPSTSAPTTPSSASSASAGSASANPKSTTSASATSTPGASAQGASTPGASTQGASVTNFSTTGASAPIRREDDVNG